MSIAVIALGACASPTGPASGHAPVDIGGGVEVTPPAAPGYLRDIHLSQLIRTVGDGSPYTIQAEVDLGPDAVIAVFSLPGGPPAMTVIWRAEGIETSKAPGAPAELDGQRILADIFLTHWPVDAVRRRLTSGEVSENGNLRRILSPTAGTVIEIRTEKGGDKEIIRLKNFKQGYELAITSRPGAL